MVKKILIVLIFLLSGGAMTLSSYQAFTTMAVIQGAIAAPKWEALVEGSDIKADLSDVPMELSNGAYLDKDKWDGFLKEYIESFPVNKRHDILDGLTRIYIENDKVEKVIKFGPYKLHAGFGHYLDIYPKKSLVSSIGWLTKVEAQAFLIIRHHGFVNGDWLDANRITIVADDFTWKSQNLEFHKESDIFGNTTYVWESTFLDLNKAEYRKLADKIVSSEEAIIRFYGEQYYRDLEVTEKMKVDIAAMLKAIDAINGK